MIFTGKQLIDFLKLQKNQQKKVPKGFKFTLPIYDIQNSEKVIEEFDIGRFGLEVSEDTQELDVVFSVQDNDFYGVGVDEKIELKVYKEIRKLEELKDGNT